MVTASPLAVEAPEFAPRVGGLLASVPVHDVADPHVNNGIAYPGGQFCTPAALGPGLCFPTLDPDTEEKEFGGYTNFVGEPFMVYRGIECWLDGSEDYSSDARKALEAGSSHAVERAFQMLFLDTAAEVSGDTLSPVVALATLEQFMVENPYVGRPVIHVSPFTATVLVANHLLVQDLDGTLRTALGTLVVVGSGYRARDDDSNALMWITTAINIWRGPVVANVASNIVLNRGDALAEQIYSITTECQDLSGVIRINMEGI